MEAGLVMGTGNPAFRRSPELVLVDLERDTLLYHRERGRLLVLNPSAAAILRLCDGTRPEGEIARCMGERFPGADPSNLEGDVQRTVKELVELGVLTRE